MPDFHRQVGMIAVLAMQCKLAFWRQRMLPFDPAPAIRRGGTGMIGSSAAFEELNFTLVLFSSGTGVERPQIAAFARLRILFSRVQPVAAIFQFSDHDKQAPLR
jgi:hypothetical protein